MMSDIINNIRKQKFVQWIRTYFYSVFAGVILIEIVLLGNEYYGVIEQYFHKPQISQVPELSANRIDNDSIALQICSKKSVSFDELKIISKSSKMSRGTIKKALAISNLYISVFNTTNHSLRHFKKLYSNGKRENSFSKEQIEILEWFFALSENEQKKWEDSDCTSNNFEEFKNNVERLIQNN